MDAVTRIGERFDELGAEGEKLLKGGGWAAGGPAMGWLAACSHLVVLVTDARSPYRANADALTKQANFDLMKGGVRDVIVDGMRHLVEALRDDWDKGLARRIEYVVIAETFAGFLDQAEDYHRGQKKIEASVLVSAVFEDGVRKLARLHGLDERKPIDRLIDELAGQDVITDGAAKRLKAAADLRNKALHARWDEFDERDVGEAIRITRELVELMK
jgi:uncharacterized protein YutE (UPF0331/DUF86 family)